MWTLNIFKASGPWQIIKNNAFWLLLFLIVDFGNLKENLDFENVFILWTLHFALWKCIIIVYLENFKLKKMLTLKILKHFPGRYLGRCDWLGRFWTHLIVWKHHTMTAMRRSGTCISKFNLNNACDRMLNLTQSKHAAKHCIYIKIDQMQTRLTWLTKSGVLICRYFGKQEAPGPRKLSFLGKSDHVLQKEEITGLSSTFWFLISTVTSKSLKTRNSWWDLMRFRRWIWLQLSPWTPTPLCPLFLSVGPYSLQ